MASVPVLKPAEVCRLLEKLGFAPVRQRGSHSSISPRRWPRHHRADKVSLCLYGLTKEIFSVDK
jgi:hypothetical protein